MSAAKANATVLPVDDKRRAHEPSIEEILASIRRIISDDQHSRQDEAVSGPNEAIEPEPSAPQRDNFLHESSTGRSVAAEEEPARAQHPDQRRDNLLRHLKASNEAQSRGAFRQAAEILEAAERDLPPIATLQADHRAIPGAATNDIASERFAPLLSAATAASIAAQFDTLAVTRLFEDGGRMDDLARDLVRPMLQEWLDDNLPGIVEKLVRAEIERVARGGRT